MPDEPKIEDQLDVDDLWQFKCADLAAEFGYKCAELKDNNPFANLVALDNIMNCLMTELWDNCFSQTEIKAAFEGALADMPRYTAGQEKRS